MKFELVDKVKQKMGPTLVFSRPRQDHQRTRGGMFVGWTIVAALRLRQAGQDLFARTFGASLADGRLKVVQAPIFLYRSCGPIDASSFAELFAHIGFAEPELWAPSSRLGSA